MPQLDLPTFGSLILCAILIASSYTFSVALVAGRARPALLPAARAGVYGTTALVALAVCSLAYAFQAHDFRIRYVMRYSDRAMEWFYLVASLWGGQDGSLLWWTPFAGRLSLPCSRCAAGGCGSCSRTSSPR